MIVVYVTTRLDNGDPDTFWRRYEVEGLASYDPTSKAAEAAVFKHVGAVDHSLSLGEAAYFFARVGARHGSERLHIVRASGVVETEASEPETEPDE